MPVFHQCPAGSGDNRDFGNIEQGLLEIGFSAEDTAKVMGNNWLQFFDANFGPV